MVSECFLIFNSAATIFVGFPRFSREINTPIYIDLHILPIKGRINYENFLLIHKNMQSREPSCLKKMLELRESSSMNLQSNHDTWKLVEHTVPGPGFTERFFFNIVHFICITPCRKLFVKKEISNFHESIKNILSR